MDAKMQWLGMPLAAIAIANGIMTLVYPLMDLPAEPRSVWPIFPTAQIPSTAGSRTAIEMARGLGLG